MAAYLLATLILLAAAGAQAQSSFPYCPCTTKVPYPPYQWSLTSKTSSSGSTRYCYAITTTKYTGSTPMPCTNYDLKKIEIDAVRGCTGFMVDITFNGDTIARSAQFFGDYGTTAKITRGSRPLATFEYMLGKTVEVCYTLTGSCSTEEKFCKGGVPCKAVFFDMANRCCPYANTLYAPPISTSSPSPARTPSPSMSPILPTTSPSPVRTPSPSKASPSPAMASPSPSKASPSPAMASPSPVKTPSPSKASPSPAMASPSPSKASPSPAMASPSPSKSSPSPSMASPSPSMASPSPSNSPILPTTSPSPAMMSPSPMRGPSPPVTIGRPPAPTGTLPFPYCPCNNNVTGPYSLSGPTATTVGGLNRYCFTVSTKQAPASYCSNYDLRKIEINIALNCRTTAKDLTFDGQHLASSYQSFPAPTNGLSFKVTRPYSQENPLGTYSELLNKDVEVCFTLRSGPCSTLDTFCRGGSCVAAFFSPNNKCCPLSFF